MEMTEMLKETPNYGENGILSRAQAESGVHIFTSLRFTHVIATEIGAFARCPYAQKRAYGPASKIRGLCGVDNKIYRKKGRLNG